MVTHWLVGYSPWGLKESDIEQGGKKSQDMFCTLSQRVTGRCVPPKLGDKQEEKGKI